MEIIPRHRGVLGALEAMLAPHTAQRVEVFSGIGNDLARIAALFDASPKERPVIWNGVHVTAIHGRPVVIDRGYFVTTKRPSRLRTAAISQHISEAHGAFTINRRGILQGVSKRKDGRFGLILLDATITPTSRAPIL